MSCARAVGFLVVNKHWDITHRQQSLAGALTLQKQLRHPIPRGWPTPVPTMGSGTHSGLHRGKQPQASHH